MNLNGIFWMLLTFLLSVAAAESLGDLTCNVSKLSDGLFVYQLSRPPSSPTCITCWENRSATVFARDSNFLRLLVHNLTNSSIVLKNCEDYMRFTKNCDGVFEEALCQVNCTLLLDSQITASTTLVSILVPVGVVFLVIVIWLLLYKKCKHIRLSWCTPYTPASTNLQMDETDTQNSTQIQISDADAESDFFISPTVGIFTVQQQQNTNLCPGLERED